MSDEEPVSWGMTLPRTVVKRTARAKMRVGYFILSGCLGLWGAKWR